MSQLINILPNILYEIIRHLLLLLLLLLINTTITTITITIRGHTSIVFGINRFLFMSLLSINVLVQLLTDWILYSSVIILSTMVMAMRSIGLVQVTHVQVGLVVITDIRYCFIMVHTRRRRLYLITTLVRKGVEFRTCFRIWWNRLSNTEYLLYLLFFLFSIIMTIVLFSIFDFLFSISIIVLIDLLMTICVGWINIHIIIDCLIDYLIKYIDYYSTCIVLLDRMVDWLPSTLITITIHDLIQPVHVFMRVLFHFATSICNIT